jgi:hypothetical protein
MIKLKIENFKNNKKELLRLYKETPEANVKQNSVIKTDSVLEKNVPRYYSDFFFNTVISNALTKFTSNSRHQKAEVLRFYKASLSKDSYIEWHVGSDQGQYECFVGVDTKGINIDYYDHTLCENKTFELFEGEILFIPTHIPRAIQKVTSNTKLIILYLNIHEYIHQK